MKEERLERTKRIGTIIVIISVILSFIIAGFYIYFLNNMDEWHTGEAKNISIHCNRSQTTNNVTCDIEFAEKGVDFTKVRVEIRSPNKTIVAFWSNPIIFQNNMSENKSSMNPVSCGRIIDNGDGQFGINDNIFLIPLIGVSLIGLRVFLIGDWASGDTTII